MRTSDFSFELPREQIAQDPLGERSASRMLVMNRRTGTCEHTAFCQITDYLTPGDCLVLNNTKVMPARLLGERAGTGATIEILLLKRLENDVWETLVCPGKKARTGTEILFGGGVLKGKVLGVEKGGNRRVRFAYDGIFEEILDRIGKMPLPPYITHELKDKNRYQTVYAKYEGSAAAPTAGLHFTPELLSKVREMSVEIAEVTLHVGLGTFRPVKTQDIEDHQMHTEYYEITADAARQINEVRTHGGRVVCVGTTSCRTLEAAADESGNITPGTAWTDIFIYPGYQFRVTDGLLTNFHLPESTLIMLVSAFAGREQVLAAYREAVREGYRFFSFGDAMLLI